MSDPREQVQRLARTDTVAATRIARKIDDPLRRTQALAWCARYSDDQTLQLAKTAQQSAARCDDLYWQTTALAWVVAALAERTFEQQAGKVLDTAIEQAAGITPAASRAEVLFLLMQAAAALGRPAMERAAERLESSCGKDEHWRCRRAVRDAERLLAGERSPRAFFW